ncbi:hypothetical protein ACI1US_02073 [Leucobacter sp. BZR 635]
MSARERALRWTVDALSSGQHVEVQGVAGSGRSTLLRELETLLIEDGWIVRWVRGIQALSTVPFAALAVQGASPHDGQAGSPSQQLAAHLSALRRELTGERCVLLVDTVEEVDDASWGVVTAALELQPELRAVTARHIADTPRQTARRLHSLSLQIPPLTFRELRAETEARLGGPIEHVSLGQIFARSGALPGLARDIVDAAVLNGSLLRVHNTWVMQGGLWSPELSGSVARLLSGLPEADQDALQLVAITGVSDLETIRRLVDQGAIERLEAHGLIRVFIVEDRPRVTVHPPLLEDYFRHQPSLAKRSRLIALLGAGFEGDARVLHVTGLIEPVVTAQENAVIVRLVQEQSRTSMHVAVTEWQARPNATTAAAAVRAMTTGGASDDEVEAVLTADLTAPQDPVARTRLLLLRAEWVACAKGDLDGALALLHDGGTTTRLQAAVIDASTVSLEHALRSVPGDFGERLAVTDEVPAEVQIRMLRSRTVANTSSGNFSAADLTLHEAESVNLRLEDFALDSLRGVVHIGFGDLEAAIRWSRRGYRDALVALDVDSIRSHAAVLVYALESQGRYAEAEEVLATVIPLAHRASTMSTLAAELAIQGCAALIAARRGRDQQAERHLAVAAGLGLPGVPPLHQAPAEAEAQLLIARQQRAAAADLLWSRGADLSARGYRFPGVLLWLASLEVAQDADRLAQLRLALPAVEGEFVHSYAAAIEHMHSPDSANAVLLAKRLHAAGRTGLALSILDLTLEDAKGDTADAVRRESERIREESPGVVFETGRFQPGRRRLTDRETEVARLLAEGLSNAQIAERLVVSVRTVESHAHRVLRKLGAANRHAIAQLLAASEI